MVVMSSPPYGEPFTDNVIYLRIWNSQPWGRVKEMEKTNYELVERILEKDEEIIYVHESQVDEKLNFGDSYVVFTSKRLLFYNPSTGFVSSFYYSNIRRIEIEENLNTIDLYIRTLEGDRILFATLLRKGSDLLKDVVSSINSMLEEGRYDLGKLSDKLHRTKAKETAKKRFTSMIFSIARPYWHLLLLNIVLTLIITALTLVPPYLIKILVDDVLLRTKSVGLLIHVVLVLVGVHLASAITSMARGYLTDYLGHRIVYDLRVKLFHHVESLGMDFFRKNPTGRIVSRILYDTSHIRYFLTWGLNSLIRNMLTLIGIGVILFAMNMDLAMIALIPIPLIIVGIRLFMKSTYKAYHRVWRSWSDVSSLVTEAIMGIDIIKIFNKEREEYDRFVRKLRRLVKLGLDITKLHIEFFPTLSFIISSTVAMVWYWGGIKVLGEALTLGMLTSFIGYMWQFYGPIQELTWLLPSMQEARTCFERVFEVLEEEPNVKDSDDAVDLDIKGKIEFRDVYFSYDGIVPVLKGVSFEIKPGEVVALVGPSGSGKTTIAKLIARFYEPTKGQILIDGVDIRRIKLESLRRQIGIVPQEPFLFNDSVANNIAYGKVCAEPEEIIAAAKIAKAHDFIMKLPEAYDTIVGERGLHLSTGEKQRITIARLLLKDPKIVILDEATSSVDSITEKELHEALSNLIKGRTTIIIAHRLSTVRNADRILVVDKGRIVEMGTHDELMKRGGLYAKLYSTQYGQRS